MNKSYLEFRLVDTKPKTFVYSVNSKSTGFRLGIIMWYGTWRQYCFFPEESTIFSKGCLEEINNFIKSLKNDS